MSEEKNIAIVCMSIVIALSGVALFIGACVVLAISLWSYFYGGTIESPIAAVTIVVSISFMFSSFIAWGGLIYKMHKLYKNT